LFPQRIDLGLGRAPGGDQTTAMAMGEGRYPTAENFPEHVQYLVAYLDDAMPKGHPFAKVKAQPMGPTAPEVWLLGSRTESAYLAAMLGLPFSYAHFFAIAVEDGPAIVEGYRRHFRPSAYLSEPKVGVGVHVLCAETEAEARRLATSRNLAKLKTALGQRGGVPSAETALAYRYSPQELAYIAEFSRSYIDGNPQQVKAGLEAIAEQYKTTDISIVTICYGFAERVRSYELVAEVCGLKPQTASTPLQSPPAESVKKCVS